MTAAQKALGEGDRRLAAAAEEDRGIPVHDDGDRVRDITGHGDSPLFHRIFPPMKVQAGQEIDKID